MVLSDICAWTLMYYEEMYLQATCEACCSKLLVGAVADCCHHDR